jgi:hypothetical protein
VRQEELGKIRKSTSSDLELRYRVPPTKALSRIESAEAQYATEE